MQVCRVWNEAVSEAVELRYAIALGSGGMVDGTCSRRFDTATRLGKLEALHAAWSNFDAVTSLTYTFESPRFTYDLPKSVFGRCYSDTQSIEFTRLQSRFSEVDSSSWTLDITEGRARIRDSATDPALDVLVVLTQVPM